MNYHIDILPFSVSKKHPFKFDKNGVILTKIPYTQEYHHHTTSIASCAIYYMDIDEKKAKAQINWLVNNILDNGGYNHHFKLPFYNFDIPWVGGLAQGLAISALIKANEIKTAEKAFKCLKNECVFIDKFSNTWIEEYPTSPPTQILNGFIYALFGVYDLFTSTKNKEAEELWKRSLMTLKENLKRYDAGFWSKYSLHDNLLSTEFYHKVHIRQLKRLNELHPHIEFENYAKKWEIDLHRILAKTRSGVKRNIAILKKKGFFESWNSYNKRKRWLNG